MSFVLDCYCNGFDIVLNLKRNLITLNTRVYSAFFKVYGPVLEV